MDTEFLDRFGYYIVCGQKYYNKLEAFSVAFKQGYHPHWYFHENIFDQVTWDEEPKESLSELYKKRALELRERYDILVLNFSGGPDSSSVADVFIENNIKLDYLLNRNVSESIRERSFRIDEDNLNSEATNVAYPRYLELKKLQPDLQFISWNYGNYILNEWANSKEVDPYSTNNYAPDLPMKTNINLMLPEKDRNKKICFIHSIDKPVIFYKDNDFQMTFIDQSFLQQIPSSSMALDRNISYEVFFWSPNCTKMLVKQGHIVKNFFKSHPELMHLISNFPAKCDSDIWKTLMNGLIYDISKRDIWQVKKSNVRWHLDSYFWFFNSASDGVNKYNKFWKDFQIESEKIFKDEHKSLIYRNGKFDGLPSCFSKFYSLGK